MVRIDELREEQADAIKCRGRPFPRRRVEEGLPEEAILKLGPEGNQEDERGRRGGAA